MNSIKISLKVFLYTTKSPWIINKRIPPTFDFFDKYFLKKEEKGAQL